VLPYPIIDNDELAKLLSIDEDGDLPGFKASGSAACTRCATARPASRPGLTQICRHVSEAIEDGVRILVLSDRDSNADLAPIPSLLLTAAVHQHLVREQTRTQVALVVESGDCREVHHAAVLIGYGAAAVNPYLAFESVDDLIATGPLAGLDPRRGAQLRQGARQGRPEDHVEDGHLDRLVVLRRPGVRGRRPGQPAAAALLRRHQRADRRLRARPRSTPR
jgi:glutamate synthase (NADPH/NADH) large chain